MNTSPQRGSSISYLKQTKHTLASLKYSMSMALSLVSSESYN